jgi:hypothetical protein
MLLCKFIFNLTNKTKTLLNLTLLFPFSTLFYLRTMNKSDIFQCWQSPFRKVKLWQFEQLSLFTATVWIIQTLELFQTILNRTIAIAWPWGLGQNLSEQHWMKSEIWIRILKTMFAYFYLKKNKKVLLKLFMEI